MAFAITDIIDPQNDFEQYLEVQVNEYVYDVNLGQKLNVIQYETHRCSDAELGLDNSQ